MFLKLLNVLGLLSATLASFHIQHRANCQKKQLCNGNLMCAEVCERGTVVVDKWITDALTYQQQLQMNDKMVFFEMPSTHNSAITEADGYGIEKYFISSLYGGTNMDTGDDLGEGVCQYLSLTDQLNMGVRHLEIDIWWGPHDKEVQVCHSPVPLFPFGNVSRTAEDRGINLEWEPKKLSCLGTRRPLSEVFTEIYNWMALPQNSDQVIMIYYDTKFYLTPTQVSQTNDLMRSIFGEWIYKSQDGNPLLKYTLKDFLSMGKRIMFENQNDCWLNSTDSESIVFTPALWHAHQFSAESLKEFPDCSVEGDTAWYGQKQVRALDGSFTEAATRCGVQVVSGDYTNPDDLKFNVWSWDFSEPSLSSNGCVAQLPSSRWATVDCSGNNLPYACLKNGSTDQKEWIVDVNVKGPFNKATCPEGYSFAAPHNGYANNVLNVLGLGQKIWVNAPNPLNK